jgi:chromosome segregation ATPase
MSLTRCLTGVAVTLLGAVLGAGAVDAQTARSGGGGSAQLLLELQQLAAERTSLQAQNAQLKKDLEQARQERDALKKAQQGVAARIRTSEAAVARTAAERAASEQELQRVKDRTQELIAKFRETVQTLRQVESEGATAKQNLATREQQLKVCVDHNAELYKLNGEVLDRLEHRSAWSSLARAEPFTRLKRVQLENLVDDYKAKADDQHLKSAVPPPPAASDSNPATPN